MASLAELQDRFQRHIVHDDEAVTGDISGPDDAYRQERLLIYYRAYRLRLIAALAVDYPALKDFVGEQRFEQVATAYLEARPSMVRNLRWFGDSMSGFLRNDLRFGGEPILAELADKKLRRLDSFTCDVHRWAGVAGNRQFCENRHPP